LVALLAALLTISSSVLADAKAPPRLVLQITVDQLRGDLPARYLERMGNGGFRYLLNEGVVYRDAHHAHAMTETIVGHTTLATGAYPSEHGLIGNVWYDRDSGALIYNVEDARYPLLTAGADVDRATEVDPTQRLARSEGRSPASMLVSTFGDQLAVHTAGAAKVFGVSVKDRGAVSMAGHAGKAFWFSKARQEFVTSSFYYDAYPAWVTEFNAGRPGERYANTRWTLMQDRENYLYADHDDQSWEVSIGDFGRTFPHAYGTSDQPYFATYLTISPAGDEITVAFAKQLMAAEGIGQDAVTDYLSVSLSSVDYVGHMFGASSLESEDTLLRLDRTLADLFAYVDETVGLEHTLVVLSADHGGPEAPPALNEFGQATQYVDTSAWDRAAGIEALKKRFGIGDELISEFFQPYVYLNRTAIAEAGLDLAEVELAVAGELLKFEGVSHAIPSSHVMSGQLADTKLHRLITNSHNMRRSGDVFIVFEPQWFINDFDGLSVATTHGSPWSYDTFVPVIFAGYGLEAQSVSRSIETTAVASTLSAVVGTNRPSGARGEVLAEILE
jgi:predicted AlkP superfamily pyrophosphatase or phosphodiesterase